MLTNLLKHLTIVIITAVLLAGCDTINSLRMMQINSDVEPDWQGVERIRLKSVFLGEKPYVYANVNGEELLFLLDTGARFLILMDTPKVKSLGLEKGFYLSLGGWGQQEDSKAFQTDIATIDLGGVQFDNMKAAMIPVSKSHYYLRDDEAVYDGVIGHDMMKHFTWEFDANSNEIYISRTPYQPEATAQAFEMDVFFNKISIEGRLAFNDDYAVKEPFIIDTGSRHYLKLSAAYTANKNITIDSPRVRAADFGLSGKVEHDRVILPSLTLGNIKLENVKAHLIPSDDEDDWWILGNALLNQFKTVVDYHGEMFYLIPRKPFETDHNLLGLELRKIRSGEFVVRFLFPDLPASEQDIFVGDLITRINGKPSAEITLSEYNDIASRPGDHEICIQRNMRCMTFNAPHIDGYSNR